MKLGLNVDHVATLRQARGTQYPDPAVAALLAEYAGASSIVAHLREDRRHIQERDIALIKSAAGIPFNLEMSCAPSIVRYALQAAPHQATLVPEKRKELTTEGGLDLLRHYKKVESAVKKLKSRHIRVSLFIDPSRKMIDRAKKIGAESIEINTGAFSEAKTKKRQDREARKVKDAAVYARKAGFFVAAGHGIHYENVGKIAGIREIEELNIGHSIIARSVFVGIVCAVEEMIALMDPGAHAKT